MRPGSVRRLQTRRQRKRGLQPRSGLLQNRRQRLRRRQRLAPATPQRLLRRWQRWLLLLTDAKLPSQKTAGVCCRHYCPLYNDVLRP